MEVLNVQSAATYLLSVTHKSNIFTDTITPVAAGVSQVRDQLACSQGTGHQNRLGDEIDVVHYVCNLSLDPFIEKALIGIELVYWFAPIRIIWFLNFNVNEAPSPTYTDIFSDDTLEAMQFASRASVYHILVDRIYMFRSPGVSFVLGNINNVSGTSSPAESTTAVNGIKGFHDQIIIPGKSIGTTIHYEGAAPNPYIGRLQMMVYSKHGDFDMKYYERYWFSDR